MSDLIRVELPKGCILLLTSAKYIAGLRRGKAVRRRETFEKRMAKLRAEGLAGKLAHDDTRSSAKATG